MSSSQARQDEEEHGGSAQISGEVSVGEMISAGQASQRFVRVIAA